MAKFSVAEQFRLERLSQMVGDRQLARWISDEAAASCSAEGSDELALTMAQRYLSGEPLQYIFGHWSFRNLELRCDSRGLIPRPETEMLVELVEEELRSSPWMKRLLDIGTGTGAIALSLATEMVGLSILASDVSSAALQLAEENVASQSSLKSELTLVESDLFEALGRYAPFDLIISNPPYIPLSAELDLRVSHYEPPQALFAGEDGLDVIRELISGAPNMLSGRGAMVFLEIDVTHGTRVIDLAAENGFTFAQIHRDLAGRERFAQLVY